MRIDKMSSLLYFKANHVNILDLDTEGHYRPLVDTADDMGTRIYFYLLYLQVITMHTFITVQNEINKNHA